MSHFVAMILINKDTKPSDVSYKLREVLAPYDERLDVPLYDRRCHCLGSEARRDASDAADKEIGTVQYIRDRYHADPYIAPLLKRQNDLMCSRTRLTPAEAKEYTTLRDENEARWKKAIEAHNKVERHIYLQHPMYDKPSKDCDECKGTGTYKSEYNPKSKWDWWVIGGRWAGWIRGIEDSMPEAKNRFIHGEKAVNDARIVRNSVENNSRIVVEFPSPIPDELIPFAIVTPDGEWHEVGKMGWFGCVSDEKEGWKDQARAILKRHDDTLAVAVDLHI
jgi:hypothetical protein